MSRQKKGLGAARLTAATYKSRALRNGLTYHHVLQFCGLCRAFAMQDMLK